MDRETVRSRFWVSTLTKHMGISPTSGFLTVAFRLVMPNEGLDTSSFTSAQTLFQTLYVPNGSLPMNVSICLIPGIVRWDGRPTNYLEEGLATWYQNNRLPEAVYREGEYAVAQELVEPVMEELTHAVKRVRLERNLRIGEITPNVLRGYCPGIGEDVLKRLCQPFQ